MSRRFVIEAVMLAIYGQLLVPGRQVEYILPYSTILELYELQNSAELIMPEEEEDIHAKQKIRELIAFFEQSFNKKKIERSLLAPWRNSSPLLINEQTSVTVINASEHAQYGDHFDPVETELLLTALREQSSLLTDQIELINKIIDSTVPIDVIDIEDFEFALEDDDFASEEWKSQY